MTIPNNFPVRSKIRQAVIYALKNRIKSGDQTIKYEPTGNKVVSNEGYYLSIKDVFDPPKSFEQMIDFPSANVFFASENCADVSNTQIQQNTSLISNSFTLRVEYFVHNENDPALECDKLLADLQRYFGTNYSIPDENGNATALTIYYSGHEVFGTETTRPNAYLNVEFKVWYRQRTNDPTKSC
jgi:hypothetical protein